MTAFSEFLTDAFDDALDVMGEACTVNGVSCKGVFSQFDRMSTQTETDFQPETAVSLSVSKTDFEDSPTARSSVVRTSTNTTYIIISIEDNDSGWVLGLIEEV